MNMEGDNVDISVSIGAPGVSRWNPTKEQIDMLEGLCRQGIRTPSAEQIQQITNRLSAFGHIESKNVFYWFQNHKARQRQKQKQDNISYFNPFVRKTSAFSPCRNVVCSPFYIPYTDIGLYQHQPKVLLPRDFKRKPMTEKMEMNKLCGRAAHYDQAYQECNVMRHSSNGNSEMYCNNNMSHCNDLQQTLDLFPLHPSGSLQSRTSSSSLASSPVGNSSASPCSSSDNKCMHDQGGSGDHRFFDFFC